MNIDLAPLFDAVSPTAPREDVLRRIEDAERSADDALAAFRVEVEGAEGAFQGAGHDRRIDALLALETRTIPASAAAADKAVERFMMEVGFRKRDLMPRFQALAERVRSVHRQALAAARDARWVLMARRALADPGGPSSPIHGVGFRYVKSDRYDARAARGLPPDDRVRADRFLKRLGEDPTPPELDLRPLGLNALGDPDGALWVMKAGNGNRFILRRGEAAGAPCFFVEDVGPYPSYEAWVARR